MFVLRLAMIQREPAITRKTISTPKARARILFVLSGPLPKCRKKDEVDTDLRQGENDQTDRNARRPEQIAARTTKAAWRMGGSAH